MAPSVDRRGGQLARAWHSEAVLVRSHRWPHQFRLDGLREVKRSFVQLIDQFERHGYLVDAFGQDCVDADGPPPDPGPLSPAVWAMRPSGRPGGPGPAGRSTSSVIWSRCFMTWSRAPQAARITAIRAAAGTTTPLRPDALGGCTAGESTGCWPPAPLVCDSPRTARTLAGSFG
jgi:hypothetical protein